MAWERPLSAGSVQQFQRGSIYHSGATGAHEVHGAIRDRWSGLGWENGALGYPGTDELGTPDGVGRFNHFNGSGGAGSIYWTPHTGAHAVYGSIRDTWNALGSERGRLGYPVAGEYDVPQGRATDFQGGTVTWDRATGRTTVVYIG